MKYNYLKTKEGKRKFNNQRIYYITYRIQNFLHFIGIACYYNDTQGYKSENPANKNK
jgi:hypothetical protein